MDFKAKEDQRWSENDPPTRASLLERLKTLSADESWSEFFDLYWKLIYNTARRAGLNDAEAQDVVQTTMIHITQSMGSFEYKPEQGSFKGWLRNAVQWRITDQLRRRWNTAPTEEFDVVAAATQNWEEEWEKNLFELAVAAVKTKVRATQFQIYDLCVLQQQGSKRTAELLGISVATVYMAVHRISKQVRQEVLRLSEEL